MNLKKAVAIISSFLIIMQCTAAFAQEPFSTPEVQQQTVLSDISEEIPASSAISDDTVEIAPLEEDVVQIIDASTTGDVDVIDDSTDGNDSTSAQSLSGIEGFVARMYATTLDRDPSEADTPDHDGYLKWVDYLKAGKITGSETMKSFLESDEYKAKNKSNEEFVTDLYHAVFGREPDAGGFASWVGALDNLMSRDFAITGFANSIEFKELCKSYGVVHVSLEVTEDRDKNMDTTKFLTRLYRTALERDPDIPGLNAWAAYLNNHVMGGADVVASTFTSTEYMSKNKTNEEFLVQMYKVMFDREPDAPGLQTWITYMNKTGMSFSSAVNGMAGGEEFAAVCKKYNIDPGQVTLTEERDLKPEIATIVQRIYRGLLDRNGTANELNTYIAQLANRQTSIAAIVKAVYESAEFTARNLDNAAFVQAAYKAILGREANEVEAATEVSYLNSHSRIDLLTKLIDTTDYKALCSTAGISVGTITGGEVKTVWNILDVSKYQSTIDWAAVAASGSVDGVIIRAASTNLSGLYVDPYFEANVIGAKRAGLKVGVYYTMYGTNTAECDAEVNLMLSEIAKLEAQGYYIDLPVACDLEYNYGNLSQGDLTALGSYSLSLIENAGYYPMLYTGGLSFAKNSLNISGMGGRDVWIAYYPYLNGDGTPQKRPEQHPSYPFSGYTIWQYRSDATISGISTAVDMSYAYRDYATIIATTLRSNGTKWNHLK